jgi:acetylornithine deacetylase/succinyl-diaminopimelate desuccinylase-like protein
MMRLMTTAAFAALLTAPVLADDGIDAFRAIYKELVEINTTLSSGSCTAAAIAMAAHLKAAGYPERDLHMIVPPERPEDGNLVAVLPGTDASAKPLLLLAHIDVVEAKREDWERDPFTLVEENGYFYARGSSDDKAMAAVFVDSMVRFKQEGYTPSRTIKMALTCGEETPETFNGVEYLIANYRDLIDAGMAINEGAGGRLDNDKKPMFLGIQAGEKIYQDYKLEVTNPGGHSSRPVKDNAITHLSAGLVKIGACDFPIALNEAVTAHFKAMANIETGATAAAMKAAAEGAATDADYAEIAKDPSRNSMMRTTCVATEVNAGHAKNALPQRATANVNCRILPGSNVEDIRAALAKVVDDPAIVITLEGKPGMDSAPPPLTQRITAIAEEVGATIWPGVPLVPTMSTGATDGRYLNAAGVPTYGLSGMFAEAEGTGAHGLNEHLLVKSLYDGRTFLYAVTKKFADSPDTPN